ncbi:hypothetical protein [Sulfobacillus harzensis]|uniref:Uncharacterized protein n=1 Tax=Sulfobacillus harzensis TaxID=2729629 RepID=A0A7Y0L620_9FIRM|nr:hypothetical protein [Sulfobacillus harzensis]NMP23411.1 hypothetical protein [Sulfobacillus harzensis]
MPSPCTHAVRRLGPLGMVCLECGHTTAAVPSPRVADTAKLVVLTEDERQRIREALAYYHRDQERWTRVSEADGLTDRLLDILA